MVAAADQIWPKAGGTDPSKLGEAIESVLGLGA